MKRQHIPASTTSREIVAKVRRGTKLAPQEELGATVRRSERLRAAAKPAAVTVNRVRTRQGGKVAKPKGLSVSQYRNPGMKSAAKPRGKEGPKALGSNIPTRGRTAPPVGRGKGKGRVPPSRDGDRHPNLCHRTRGGRQEEREREGRRGADKT